MNTSLPDIDPMLAATDLAAMAAFNRQLVTEFRANAGRIGGQLAGAPILVLTHVGAKTGRLRLTPLGFVPHRDGFIVAASKSGASTNPTWYHNLLATPNASVEVGAQKQFRSARWRPTMTAAPACTSD
jgi:deazaflavin-dependent oxidoreductase (nitroreductase family)